MNKNSFITESVYNTNTSDCKTIKASKTFR